MDDRRTLLQTVALLWEERLSSAITGMPVACEADGEESTPTK